jgi:hypothetical protein
MLIEDLADNAAGIDTSESPAEAGDAAGGETERQTDPPAEGENAGDGADNTAKPSRSPNSRRT